MADKKEKNPLVLTEKGMALVMQLREMGDGFTAKEVAEAMGITPQSVNGTFTSLAKRHDPAIGERVETEIEVEDAEGNVKVETVKVLNLTEYGKTADFVTAE